MKRVIKGVEYDFEDEPSTYYSVVAAKTESDTPKPILNNTNFETWDRALLEIQCMEREHLRRAWPPYHHLQITEKTSRRLKNPIPVK